MVEALVLKVSKRESLGTRAARKARSEGMVPVVIYGHKETPLAAVVSYHDLALELQHHHRLLEVDLDGRREKLLTKDVQYDYLGDKIIHADLMRVSMDERVEVTVALELKGTPAGIAEGGVLEHMLADIALECPVTAIPENIRVQVNDLKIGDTLTAGDIELPPGTKLVTDAEAPVAAVRVMAEEPEAEEEVEEAAAEPEVIGESAKEEEPEE